MYLLDPKHPAELFHARQEALIQEARDARLAGQLREARRQERATSQRRTTRFPGRAIALWERTSVPFFRA
jgi:transcription elongation GreA/GreB family factor